jgi:AbiV family abortive infection protein
LRLKSHLQPYAGPLTPAQITEGIAAAQANALRLLDDAKLLLEAGRYPSATALAILSMEERGKVIILKRLALVSDPADVKAAWREYRSHRAKNAGWIIPQLVGQGARTMQGLAAGVDADAEHTAILDALKQVSFYTDCLAKRHWSIPNEVIDEGVARSIVRSAEIMWSARAVTLREVELWGEIVGPHYNQPGMMAAVVKWQHAMVAEGLSDTTPESLAAFMRGEPVAVSTVRS